MEMDNIISQQKESLLPIVEVGRGFLSDEGCRGIVRSAKGELRQFRRRGVADLFELVTAEPDFLRGASVADRVIGRGAALLLVKGGVSEVYARVISAGALAVLRSAGIETEYGELVPNIINRSGTGICPVEQLTADTSDPDEAYERIRKFLEIKNKSSKVVSSK